MIKVCASIELSHPDSMMGYRLTIELRDQDVRHQKELYLAQNELMDQSIFDVLFDTVRLSLIDAWRKTDR